MHFLDLTLPSLEENLALDEALLLQSEEAGGEWLRVWEWPQPAVVLGAAGQVVQDVDEAACLADGVSIQRRASGGGTVLLSKGCLLFSLILSYQRAAELTLIPSSYCYILGRVRDGLRQHEPRLEIAGTSDLAVGGRKVSGNSQQRKRRHLLHHGTLLFEFDAGLVGRYLRMPARQPDYRAGRPHADFIANLPVGREALIHALCRTWKAQDTNREWPEKLVRELVARKYSLQEWRRRR